MWSQNLKPPRRLPQRSGGLAERFAEAQRQIGSDGFLPDREIRIADAPIRKRAKTPNADLGKKFDKKFNRDEWPGGPFLMSWAQ
jgi:hypothetical protein